MAADPQPGQMELVRRLAEDGQLDGSTDAPAELVALAQLVLQLVSVTRPTADLGDDGELVARLLAPDFHDPACPFRPHCYCSDDAPHDKISDADKRQAADRLILYRVALEEMTDLAETLAGDVPVTAATWAKIRKARTAPSRRREVMVMQRFDGKKEMPSFTSDTSMTHPDPEMVAKVAGAMSMDVIRLSSLRDRAELHRLDQRLQSGVKEENDG